MKIKEFRKKYYHFVGEILKQKTIDTIEDALMDLDNQESDFDFKTMKMSVHYDLDTLLEVMDKNLEDYTVLSEMCKDIEELEEDER